MSLLRATKENTCPYCNRDISFHWVSVDKKNEILFCPECNNQIDISKEDKKLVTYQE